MRAWTAMRRLSAVVIVALVGSAMMSCGSGAASQSADRQDVVRRHILTLLNGEARADRPSLLCARFPDRPGPEVELVARATGSIDRLRSALTSSRTTFTTEVQTISSYDRKISQLASHLQQRAPKRPTTIPISHEIYSGKLVCPRVYIEVGPPGHLIPSAVAWARRVVRKYGSDYVSYRAYGTLHLE
jgi:hypothetical protein